MTAPTTTLDDDTTGASTTDGSATDGTTGPGDEPTCVACAHPLSAHDPIGLRFCRATTAGSLTRGCVCRTV